MTEFPYSVLIPRPTIREEHSKFIKKINIMTHWCHDNIKDHWGVDGAAVEGVSFLFSYETDLIKFTGHFDIKD